MQFIKVIDAAMLSFIVGATLWFFFIQSPILLKKMGKEKFMPLQMHLTKALFKGLSIAALLMLVLASAHALKGDLHIVITALVVFLSASIAHFFVIPRALKAGGESLRKAHIESGQTGADMSDSVAEFASVGGSDGSKFWHRMVVLFVVFILAGGLGHGIHLLKTAQ